MAPTREAAWTRWRARGLACALLAVCPSARAGLPSPPVEQWRYEFAALDPLFSHSDTIPIVLQLTDDDGDGDIDASDSPDVVFHVSGDSFSDVELVAVHGTDASPIFRVGGPFGPLGDVVLMGCLAGADVMGDGAAEIFVGDFYNFYVYDATGTQVRSQRWLHDRSYSGHAMNLADFNQDGIPEVYDQVSVMSVDGSWGWNHPQTSSGGDMLSHAVAADVDASSPGPELFHWNALYSSDGRLLWEDDTISPSSLTVGDFDGDGGIELVLYGWDELQVVTPGGVKVGPATLVPPVSARPDSNPMAADVDGDGRLDLIVPVADSVRCLDWDGVGWREKWRTPVSDPSGASTGMTFDFDGDGALEIVYRDELGWYVIDGRCGAILSFIDSPSLSVIEFPVVANIDDDPAAEILVSTYSEVAATSRLIAYEVPGSCTPRGIFHEIAYDGTNIDDSGRIPVSPEPPWLSGLPWHGQISMTPRGLDGLQAATATPAREGCVGGARVSWEAAFTPDGTTVLYDVFAVDGTAGDPCCSSTPGAAVATDLTSEEWFDPTALGAGPRAYIVAARRGDGGGCATARACTPVVDVVDDALRPQPSDALLLAARTDRMIELTWPTSRALAVGEHFHVRRAEGSARARFDLVSPEGLVDVAWQGAMTTTPIEFYQLSIADVCEYQSIE